MERATPLKRLSDAEKESPCLFSWPTLELETVVESEHDEWVSYAEPKSAGASQIREAEVGSPRKDVAQVSEGDTVKDPEKWKAQFVVEHQNCVSACGLPVLQLRTEFVLAKATYSCSPARIEAVGENRSFLAKSFLKP